MSDRNCGPCGPEAVEGSSAQVLDEYSEISSLTELSAPAESANYAFDTICLERHTLQPMGRTLKEKLDSLPRVLFPTLSHQ
jgi:hypothetical protein